MSAEHLPGVGLHREQAPPTRSGRWVDGTRFITTEHAEWRAVGDEVVVLDLRTELYLTFNETGAALWLELAQGASIAELVARVVADFDVDEATARAGAVALLDDLVGRDLVREDHDPPAAAH